MEYIINIDGVNRTLPARDMVVDERIDKIQRIQDRLRAGEISLRDAREEQYSFVSDCLDGQLPPLDEIDITDLELVLMGILNTYQAPTRKAHIDMVAASLRELFNHPEFKKMAVPSNKRPWARKTGGKHGKC